MKTKTERYQSARAECIEVLEYFADIPENYDIIEVLRNRIGFFNSELFKANHLQSKQAQKKLA